MISILGGIFENGTYTLQRSGQLEIESIHMKIMILKIQVWLINRKRKYNPMQYIYISPCKIMSVSIFYSMNAKGDNLFGIVKLHLTAFSDFA